MYSYDTNSETQKIKLLLLSSILNTARSSHSPNGKMEYNPKYLSVLIKSLALSDVGLTLKEAESGNSYNPGHYQIGVDDTFTKQIASKLEAIAYRAMLAAKFNKLGVSQGQDPLYTEDNKTVHWIFTGIVNDEVEPYLKFDKSKTKIKRGAFGYLTVTDGTYSLLLRRTPEFAELTGIHFWISDEWRVTILHNSKVIKLLKL